MSEIVVFGHPSLTTKSVNVEDIDDYIVSLTKKMTQIMYDAPGVGLAAPQIGINKNIFVFEYIRIYLLLRRKCYRKHTSFPKKRCRFDSYPPLKILASWAI